MRRGWETTIPRTSILSRSETCSTPTTKLGFGGSSTVWLARDLRRWNWEKDRYVTLKVCTNDYGDKILAENELTISRHIATVDPSNKALYFIRTVRDSFNLDGPNGVHVCLVYDPLREPIWLFQKRFPNGRYTSDTLKHIMRFMLCALEYLHDSCHVIHTGIKPWNILVGVEDISILDAAALSEETDPSPRKIYEDRTGYRSRADLGLPKTPPGAPKLADFDAAIRGDARILHNHPIQPNIYRAPEVTLLASWTYSADIWNLGLLMWELLEAKPLCDGPDIRFDEYTCRAHLAQLIGVFGPPPIELLKRGTETAHYFNLDGTFQNPELIPANRTLEDSVQSLIGEDKRLFLAFAKKMLCWMPEERLAAKELLSDPWLSYSES
ncbi:kinase-like protein [Ceratobasidium sp. AG-I]|nr:kinase-like protein [Ceratobasidium sp. AG-I]KAF8600623.1 kinase-like protein [Ceratobasidium sp. AG-I]